MKRPLVHVVCLVAIAAMTLAVRASSGDGYAAREDVKRFVREVAAAESFDESELLGLFRQAEYKQSIIDAISRPAEKTLTWAEYQDIFLTDLRTERGAEFMREQRAALARAEERYGVPPAIIAAIIGVETNYGRNKGGYRVLDALTTLTFDYPPRSRFFRGELKEFLLLAREEGRPATELTGSYAGAMGFGQFIPSSYRHYAVDFDGDEARDIWENPVDAIGSVANYLAEHGWRDGEMITARIDSVPEDSLTPGLQPDATLGELRKRGLIDEPMDLPDDAQVSLMRLKGKQGDEYYVGSRNFYVITRYNHSRLYAMAVFQLSERLSRG